MIYLAWSVRNPKRLHLAKAQRRREQRKTGKMTENEIGKIVVDTAVSSHRDRSRLCFLRTEVSREECLL